MPIVGAALAGFVYKTLFEVDAEAADQRPPDVKQPASPRRRVHSRRGARAFN